MRYPLGFTLAQMQYRTRMHQSGQQRYPTVLMLEPLYACNLACIGCSAERHSGKISDRLPLATCLRAAEDCGAPIVNLCGGEPTLYPELIDLISGLVNRGKHIILCTNALLLDRKVYGVIPAHDHLMLMIHLDGLRQTHDRICDREGVFEQVIAQIQRGKALGYTIYLNTTVYKQTSVEEVEALCQLVNELGVEGILISPAYEYESVEADVFSTQAQIHTKFQAIREFSGKYKINNTPMFLKFAAGLQPLSCSPWSTVNYTPKGWKAPCYLIEGEGYFDTWEEFWVQTDWAYWESGQDRRCQNCKMHSGFEHSAVEASLQTLPGQLQLAFWTLGH